MTVAIVLYSAPMFLLVGLWTAATPNHRWMAALMALVWPVTNSPDSRAFSRLIHEARRFALSRDSSVYGPGTIF